MRIGELAERTGVSTDTIRFYEKQGLLDETLYERRANNYRAYSEAALERLAIVARAKRLGFSLSEIRRLGELWASEQLDETAKVQVLQEKLAELEEKRQDIESLQKMITEKLKNLRKAV